MLYSFSLTLSLALPTMMCNGVGAVPAKCHAQQLLVARARRQRQVSNEGQRDAQKGVHERLIQERVARLPACVCNDPVIPAQIPPPQAAHVPRELRG